MMNTQLLTAYFSPTGTTARIARAVADGFKCPAREVDLSASVKAETVTEETVLLAAAPVFSGRVPAVALERLSRLQGSGQMAVAVVVYGNRDFDDALLEWKEALEKNGFRVIAAAAFIAEHSIVRSIAAGRPDSSDLQKARQFGGAIEQKLAGANLGAPLQVPGKFPYKEPGGLPVHPQADGRCDKCGQCAEACPVGAIPSKSPAHTDAEKCINCMRCVAVCPQKARSLPAPTLQMLESALKAKAAGRKEPEWFL